MSLQVLEKADGTKLGLRIVDDSALSSPYSSIFSSLPLSAVKNGFAFRAHTVQAATNIFRHAKNGTEPVVGIMFTPPHIPQNGDDVVAHNVHWDCLARPAPKINEDDGGFRLSELNKFLPEIPAASKGKQK
ncbi:hypothetical protein FDECE_6199 [Fusarium decemcellulare]|nr:hypothetical protein FDECE_6199 [Fusarium decemcellulare]